MRSETKANRLAVRLTQTQRARIDAAAATGQTVTEFAMATLTRRAEAVLAEQHCIVSTAEAWDRLIRLLDEPPRPLPRPTERASHRAPWDAE
jgi:uncharacterized protein (DUF1778 family)